MPGRIGPALLTGIAVAGTALLVGNRTVREVSVGALVAQPALAVALLLLPCALVAPWAPQPPPQRAAGAVACYLWFALVLGWLAYELVPAGYTRDLAWHWPPHSSSLGEIHAIAQERAANPQASTPENARRSQQMVQREQQQFAQRWLFLSVAGLAPLAGALWLHGRLRGPTGRRSTSAGAIDR